MILKNSKNINKGTKLKESGNGTEKKKKNEKKVNHSSKVKRLRSRNRVVDSWLDEEDGSDAFADLEDFLVD